MAFMAAAIPLIAAGAGAAGAGTAAAAAASLLAAGVSAAAALKQGRDAKAMAKFQAQQQKANAASQIASGQHQALARRRESEIRESRALAVAGASGAGTLDPDVLNIISGLAAQGEKEFQAENFNAQTRAAQSTTGAAMSEIQGQQAKEASQISATSTFLSGAIDAGTSFFGAPRGAATTNANTLNALNRSGQGAFQLGPR